MKGGLGNLMKQAQQMQADMQKAQQEIASLVKVTMTGRHEASRVKIDDSLVGDDKDMLEDLIAAAINDATHKVEAATQERMSGVTAGMNLPAGMKLPF
jgi:hypothetical protein